MEQSKFYQIKNITEYEYTLVGCDGSVITRPIQDVDKSASAFTIQDAKDGDVLAWDDSKCIALFKNIYDEDSFNSHGFVGHCTGTFESRLSYHDIKGAHPATKEQRDLLFEKMHKAGYEWDAEKKELKLLITNGGDFFESENCEQKPAWSEEDEYRVEDIIYFLDTAKKHYASTIELDACIDWIKSLNERMGK